MEENQQRWVVHPLGNRLARRAPQLAKAHNLIRGESTDGEPTFQSEKGGLEEAGGLREYTPVRDGCKHYVVFVEFGKGWKLEAAPANKQLARAIVDNFRKDTRRGAERVTIRKLTVPKGEPIADYIEQELKRVGGDAERLGKAVNEGDETPENGHGGATYKGALIYSRAQNDEPRQTLGIARSAGRRVASRLIMAGASRGANAAESAEAGQRAPEARAEPIRPRGRPAATRLTGQLARRMA